MAVYGYDRASTKQQNVDRGIAEITNFCRNRDMELVKIFTDKISGKTFVRERYTVLVDDILRSGDILIIPEMDRFGRTKKNILEELRKLKEKDVRVMILDIPTTCIDTSTLGNDLAKMLIEMVTNTLIEVYATMAEAEMMKRSKRIREGMDAKKARGEWEDFGRKRVMEQDQFEKLYLMAQNKNFKATQFMKEHNLSKGTYYRYLKELKEKIDN